ncbi:RINT1-like protein [Escovopsis weberi]|uniref:RINT1-like protein n=1 Tax=Escovopsis weberi TaxID=150374 RepID=A0A0M9VS84_ESCWE|nr:RINT1-like protein [Escovopsis weberi]
MLPVPGKTLDERVEDYLDDRLQSVADLDTLDHLLASVELQRNQLQAQLDDAARELDAASRAAGDRQAFIYDRIAEFRQLQDSIDERVQAAADSDAPSAAISRLQQPMRQLQSVTLAQNYLVVLRDVERLRAEARSHLPQSPRNALQPYAQLKEVVARLEAVPENESLDLLDFVRRTTASLWVEMKGIMSAELEAVLDKRHWPKVDPQSPMDDDWIACVDKLVDLQMPEILRANDGDVVALLPVEVMANMFIAEFRFHFLSDKLTSSPQSVGSHCFPWFLTTLEKWEDFFRDNLSHLLASKFHDTPAATKMVYVDPVCALITAMLPVLREKIRAAIAETDENPLFLSGLMSQLTGLDETLRNRFNYDGGDPDNGWPGLAAEVLEEHFQMWFQAERQLALERFEAITASQDGRKIDYNYSVSGKMKPTYAAVQITDLLRAVTAKYERLRRVKHKLRFLTGIQLDVLDGYYDRLRGSLEAYQSLTSTLGRTLHGVAKEQQAALEGTGALETLCKVIGSCDHVATTLMEWNDEEVFVLLWDQLHKRDSKGNKHTVADVESEGRGDIRGRTSVAVTQGDEGGAIFDETVSAYTARRKAAEDLLVGALVDSHSKALRAYMQHVQWTTVDDAHPDDPASFSITSELDEPLRVMRTNLDFLSKALSAASLRRVWHDALDKLQDLLWGGLVMRQTFTAVGAAQFAHDMGAVFSLVDHYMAGGSAAMGTLHEAICLLNLPGPSAEEGGEAGDKDGRMTLKSASDRVFKNNEEARGVLEELGLVSLTPGNARQILQRRIENNENIGW